MSSLTPALEHLIQALCCLPGVGPKSAQRMAFYLLDSGRDNAKVLDNALAAALQKIGRCEQCRTFSETPKCPLCANPKRQSNLLCIVETPADILAIEQTHTYNGRYFVLGGHLSPLDGIGPAELGLAQLDALFTEHGVQEVILATSTTVEGNATASFIADMAKQKNLQATRIARGVPSGGELDLVDVSTLMQALSERVTV